jgi:hypothetical protein
MDGFRLVTLTALRARLETVLGGDSLLFRQMDRALADQDDHKLEAAMDSLRLYPAEIRAGVQEAIVDWLLGDLRPSGLERAADR